MPNQIPLSEAVNAAGGFLVPQDLGDVLINGVARQAAALQLANVERISTNRAAWPVYLGRPTAGFVGEGADKPVTGAEFGELLVNIKKLATFVVYTEELLEDARIDPQVLVNQDVEGAFSDIIDANMIGTHPGGASTQTNFSTNFDSALANTTQTIELGTGADALALAISGAMGMIEGNGYLPNGIAYALDVKGHLRDARDTQGRPLYTDGFNDAGDGPYGMRQAFSTNLDGFPAGLLGGAGTPGKTVAVIGDWGGARAVIRRDLSTAVFREGTIGTHNLMAQNKVAVRWEMRMGFQVHDLNRRFVRIVNAA
jgi:HK97 family phage major capsid protein